MHRPLGQRVQREVVAVDPRLLERHVPERQRIEIGRNPFPVGLGRLHPPMAMGGQAKALQRFDVELQHDRSGSFDESHRHRGFEIGLVRVFEIELVGGQSVFPKAAIGDIALELVRIRGSPTRLVALRTAPAAQRAHPGPALMIDDIVRITAGEARLPFRRDKTGQPEPLAQFDQHVLERANVAVGG